MATGSLVVCHPRERGDPEGEFFLAWKTKNKYKVNLINKKTFLASHNKLKRNEQRSDRDEVSVAEGFARYERARVRRLIYGIGINSL